jgi:DNA-binding transcriptional MerR regulator
MADTPAATGHLSIGEVLALLLEEFPDVTISKIRFLESQGLIDPERTTSGYRKFYAHDVELLRCILREQRENYLPLKVIKDRIDSGEIDPTNEQPRPRGIKNVGDPVDDAPQPSKHPSAGGARTGDGPEPVTGAEALFVRTDGEPPAVVDAPDAAPDESSDAPARAAGADVEQAPGSGAPPAPAPRDPTPPGAVLPGVVLSSDELCAMSGLTRDQLDELRSYGVVVGTSSRGDEPYDDVAVEVATVAKRMLDAGLEARHLRGWRVAAEREAGLLDQLVQPLLRQRNPEARAQAVSMLAELEEDGGRLRTALVRSALRQHGPV